MDSDKCRHRENEFYYPEEETLNQTKPLNRDKVELDGHLNSIQGKTYVI